MNQDRYQSSKSFVKEMRALAANRDLASIRFAVERMQAWMEAHPDDPHVGTALEEFDILAEAAGIVEGQKLKSPSAA